LSEQLSGHAELPDDHAELADDHADLADDHAEPADDLADHQARLADRALDRSRMHYLHKTFDRPARIDRLVIHSSPP
jgi:hypothetical protein